MTMLYNLLMNNGFQLKRKTAKEYAGPCPFCGGEDRFIVQIDKERYWCRQCKKSGDAIQFLRDYKGMTYRDACEAIGVEAKTKYISPIITQEIWTPREPKKTTNIWNAKAKEFVDHAINTLWDTGCSARREWLATRGLSEKTIRAAGLGWNPRVVWQERGDWGLDSVISEETGRAKKLWAPMGLVIPYCQGADVIRIRIRRSNPGDGSRYILLPGCDTRAMIQKGDNTKAVVIVESELDALLLWEKASDLVTCIALGNAQARPDVAADKMLKQADIILNALDSDRTGAKEAWTWWPTHYKKVKTVALY